MVDQYQIALHGTKRCRVAWIFSTGGHVCTNESPHARTHAINNNLDPVLAATDCPVRSTIILKASKCCAKICLSLAQRLRTDQLDIAAKGGSPFVESTSKCIRSRLTLAIFQREAVTRGRTSWRGCGLAAGVPVPCHHQFRCCLTMDNKGLSSL